MEFKGIIYKITNKINSKCYIGQTVRSLNKRIHEHKQASKSNNLDNDHLVNAFK